MARSKVSPLVWLLAIGTVGLFAWKKYGTAAAATVVPYGPPAPVPYGPPAPATVLIVGLYPGTRNGPLVTISRPITDAEADDIFSKDGDIMQITDSSGHVWHGNLQ